MQPTLRKPFGVLGIIAGLVAYVALVASLAEPIGRLHALLQAPIYILFGIAWILPLKPVLRWMETGRWSAK